MSSLSHRLFIYAFLGLLIYGCTPKTVTNTGKSNYSEDLTIYRPPLALDTLEAVPDDTLDQIAYVVPTNHLKAELDSIVSLTTYYNDKKDYVEGYTIQVYTGTSRDEANRAQVKIYSVLGQASPWVDYTQPVYKVKVGKFYTKLEANKLHKQLKQKFPNALLIPQRFRMK